MPGTVGPIDLTSYRVINVGASSGLIATVSSPPIDFLYPNPNSFNGGLNSKSASGLHISYHYVFMHSQS